jgi:hypothetical protein
MLRPKPWLMIPLAAVIVLAASCTGNDVDDGDSADVVLEVETLENPPVTGQLTNTSSFCSLTGVPCSTGDDCGVNEVCQQGQVCELTVEDWRAPLAAFPKSGVAVDSIPFNDVIINSITVTYSNPAWPIDGQTRVIGVGGIAVPVGDTAEVTFSPISFDDLDPDTMEGTTADLVMVFNAITVEGTAINLTVLRQLFIETCT